MAYLTSKQRAERAYVLRELLLRPALRRRDDPSPDYLSAITDLTDDLVVTDTNGVLAVSTTDMMGNPDDHRHDIVTAARLVMGQLETAPGRASTRAHLSAGLAHRGFTAPTTSAALSWLTEQKLITVTNGTVTDVSGDRRPSKARPALPAELLAPRSVAAAQSTTGTTAPARPRMDVGNLIEPPEQVDMGARMREQATMPNPSFEVGTSNKTTVKKDEKTSTVAIPDSAVVAYKTAVLDAFARTGKVTATWNELGVKRPALGDLPEGTTPAKVLDEAIARMHASGEVRASKSSRTFTYIPAKRFVDAVTSRITEVARTHPDFTIAASTVEGTESLAALAPSGWDIEPLAQMAIDMAVSSGVLIMVDGLARTKPAPEAVEPEPETSDTKPAGDTTSPKPKTEPEGTRTVAKTEGKVVETPETKVSETPVETAKNGVPEPEAPKSEGKAPAKRESVQVVTAPTPDMTPWLASIDGNIRHLTQILALPQASAREALSEGALLQSTLRRVMVLLERHGVLTNGELQRAFNGKLPAQREALEIALKYGVAVGALAATGAKNPKGWGARYTLADPTRVGIARHEILNEAMKKRTPKPKPKAS